METIKYPFGETPEDVIRERAAACREIPLIDLTPWQMVAGAKPDDLLTVLDALLCCDAMEVPGATKLRIEILAALGSDEGGE